MEVRALGPVALIDHGDVFDIDVAKHRALLAVLALRGGDIVSTAELIDALWGDDPPTTATKTLQGYVSALRRDFGHDLIQTVPGGYQLGPGVDEVDVIGVRAGDHLGSVTAGTARAPGRSTSVS